MKMKSKGYNRGGKTKTKMGYAGGKKTKLPNGRS